MDLVINKDSQEPIYNQIYFQITSQILNHSLKAGEQLPTIRSIANELRISVIPVKMAWESLEKNGFILTKTGKGTFIADITSDRRDFHKSKEAEKLAEQACRKAKELGLTEDEFIQLIKEKNTFNPVLQGSPTEQNL